MIGVLLPKRWLYCYVNCLNYVINMLTNCSCEMVHHTFKTTCSFVIKPPIIATHRSGNHKKVPYHKDFFIWHCCRSLMLSLICPPASAPDHCPEHCLLPCPNSFAWSVIGNPIRRVALAFIVPFTSHVRKSSVLNYIYYILYIHI